MARTIVSNLASIDGFFEGPNHEIDRHVVDEEFFAYAKGLLRETGAILFGRKTYEHMAAYWPTAASDGIADAMNTLPKVVFSRSLASLDWQNSRLVTTEAAEEVRRLRRGPGKDLVILGSSDLVSYLLARGLIDEYRMIVNPIILGRGKPQLSGIPRRINAKLTSSGTLKTGVVILSYAFRRD